VTGTERKRNERDRDKTTESERASEREREREREILPDLLNLFACVHMQSCTTCTPRRPFAHEWPRCVTLVSMKYNTLYSIGLFKVIHAIKSASQNAALSL
jgi:hypothetical protein